MVRNILFGKYYEYRNKQFLNSDKSETFSSKYLNNYEKLRDYEQNGENNSKINLLNLESNARYMHQKYNITIDQCAMYPKLDSFFTINIFLRSCIFIYKQ